MCAIWSAARGCWVTSKRRFPVIAAVQQARQQARQQAGSAADERSVDAGHGAAEMLAFQLQQVLRHHRQPLAPCLAHRLAPLEDHLANGARVDNGRRCTRVFAAVGVSTAAAANAHAHGDRQLEQPGDEGVGSILLDVSAEDVRVLVTVLGEQRVCSRAGLCGRVRGESSLDGLSRRERLQ